mmetsp:Transcript_101300/g.180021  ORF Transcript_101300/g.180021 Transcript_101300/m.180021 type:complete len:230 (+) Transcript_101300:449-1138(+)
MVPPEARCFGTAPNARPKAYQIALFIPRLFASAVHHSATVVRAMLDVAQGLVRCMVNELQRDASPVQVRACEDEVDKVTFGVQVMITYRLDTLCHKDAVLRRGASRACWHVVLDVSAPLTVGSHIAACACLDGTRIFWHIIFVLKDKLHVNFVNGLLRAIRALALGVRVNQEDSILATTPTSDISGDVAGWIASGCILCTAVSKRWIRLPAIDSAFFDIELSLWSAGTL